MIYQVGEKYAPITGRPEGVIFDIDDAGAILIYNFAAPTQKEIDATKAGNRFEIRFIEMGGIIWILSKCGSLEWTDSPYDPHLSVNLTELRRPDPGQGLSLTLMMTDANTTEIKSLRLIGLGEKFSNRLIDTVERVRAKPFDFHIHSLAISAVMAVYDTRKLVDLAGDYCKLK